MAIKMPDELSGDVVNEMQQLIFRARGRRTQEGVYNRVLTTSERKWADASFSRQEWYQMSGAMLMQKVRGLSYVRAVLDIALALDHVSREKYDYLLREIGADDNVQNSDVARAVEYHELVLTDCPRTAYWMGDEIDVDFGKDGVLWWYVWKLARAAKFRGFITAKDFEPLPQPKTLDHWKHRLTSKDAFPFDLADQIDSMQGQHWLGVEPHQIRLFVKCMDVGYQETRH